MHISLPVSLLYLLSEQQDNTKAAIPRWHALYISFGIIEVKGSPALGLLFESREFSTLNVELPMADGTCSISFLFYSVITHVSVEHIGW